MSLPETHFAASGASATIGHQHHRKVSFDAYSSTCSNNSFSCSYPLSPRNEALDRDLIATTRFLDAWSVTPNTNTNQPSNTNSNQMKAGRKRSASETTPSSSSSSSSSSISNKRMSRLSRSGCLKSLVSATSAIDESEDSLSLSPDEHMDVLGSSYYSNTHALSMTSSGNSSCAATKPSACVSDDDLFGGLDAFDCTEHEPFPVNPLVSMSSFKSDSNPHHSNTNNNNTVPASASGSLNSKNQQKRSSSSSQGNSQCSGWGHFIDVVPTDRDIFKFAKSSSSLSSSKSKSKSKSPRRALKRLSSFRNRSSPALPKSNDNHHQKSLLRRQGSFKFGAKAKHLSLRIPFLKKDSIGISTSVHPLPLSLPNLDDTTDMDISSAMHKMSFNRA